MKEQVPKTNLSNIICIDKLTITLKGACHEIFDLFFFIRTQSWASDKHILHKSFQIRFRFRRDIRIFLETLQCASYYTQ